MAALLPLWCRLSVPVSLCLLVSVSPEITAEPIEMPLDGALVWTQGTNQILDDGRPLTKGQF